MFLFSFSAHESLEKVKANLASETTRLQALVKRKEMQLESTEKSLEQKVLLCKNKLRNGIQK